MSEPLIVIVCQDPAGLVMVIVGAAAGVPVALGWAYGRWPEIAASWEDGVQQLAAWRDAVRARAAAVAPLLVPALALLLARLVPGGGAHRWTGVAR